MPGYEAPPEFMRDGIISHCPASGFTDNIYTFRTFPLFIDLNNGKQYDLSRVLVQDKKAKFFKDHTHIYWAMEAHRMDNNTLMIAYIWQKQHWVAWVDLPSKKLIRQSKVDLNDMDQGSVHFMDDGRLIGISKDYKSLLIKQ